VDLKNRIAAVQKKKLKNHVVASLMKFAIARKKNLVGAQKAIAPVNKKFNLLQVKFLKACFVIIIFAHILRQAQDERARGELVEPYERYTS